MVYLIAKDKESDGQASRAIDFRLEAFRMKISFRHHSLPPPTTTPTLGSQGSSRVDTNKVGASIPSQYQVSSIPPVGVDIYHCKYCENYEPRLLSIASVYSQQNQDESQFCLSLIFSHISSKDDLLQNILHIPKCSPHQVLLKC